MCRIETVFFLELHMNVETWNRCEHACMNSMCTLHVADYKATLFKITSFLQIQKVLISTTTISF